MKMENHQLKRACYTCYICDSSCYFLLTLFLAYAIEKEGTHKKRELLSQA